MTETITQTLVGVTCCVSSCGVTFGLNEEHHRSLKKSHEDFFCPNGHILHFPQMTDAERLARELKYAEQSRDMYRDHLHSCENSLRSMRGVVTKLKRRSASGVCQCCHRHFENVAAHYKSKHPAFVKELAERAK